LQLSRFSKINNDFFHGAWSIAGFTGALVGLLTMNLGLNTFYHFLIILVIVTANTLINQKYLGLAANLLKGKA
jgi:hypothetical protein